MFSSFAHIDSQSSVQKAIANKLQILCEVNVSELNEQEAPFLHFFHSLIIKQGKYRHRRSFS